MKGQGQEAYEDDGTDDEDDDVQENDVIELKATDQRRGKKKRMKERTTIQISPKSLYSDFTFNLIVEECMHKRKVGNMKSIMPEFTQP